MKVLLATAILAVVIATTYGLKCYQCEDDDTVVGDGDCGDTFIKDDNMAILMMCNDTAGEVFCRKQKTGVNHVYTTIERGCAKNCEERNTAFVDRVTCCETDGCNAGSNVQPAIFVLLCSALYGLVKAL
jgi:hypothetical protein